MVAAPETQTEGSNIWVAASEGNLDRVKELVKGGISPEAEDSNTYTPLHAASSWGHIAIIEYLVGEMKANVNKQDSDGESALFVVESWEVANALLSHGADATLKNKRGQTPARSLQGNFPEIATRLAEKTGETLPETPDEEEDDDDDDNHSGDGERKMDGHITEEILKHAIDIVNEAEGEGRDPSEDLQELLMSSLSDKRSRIE